MLEFKHGFWSNATHVLNRVLITNVIRPFNGVIHVPAPVVVRILAGNSASDTALRGYCMRTGWEYLGYHRRFVTRLRKLKRGSQP